MLLANYNHRVGKIKSFYVIYLLLSDCVRRLVKNNAKISRHAL